MELEYSDEERGHASDEYEEEEDPNYQPRYWTEFEETALIALICKGEGLSRTGGKKLNRTDLKYHNSQYRKASWKPFEAYDGQLWDPVGMATELNNTLNPRGGGTYEDDVPIDDVVAKLRLWAHTKKGALALLRRQIQPRLTRTLRLAFQRDLNFDGTVAEWEGDDETRQNGRKYREQVKPRGPYLRSKTTGETRAFLPPLAMEAVEDDEATARFYAMGAEQSGDARHRGGYY